MSAPVAQPVTPSEWEEFLNTALETPEKFAALAKDGTFKAKLDGYTSAYRNEVNSTMKDLKGQLTDQVSASVLEMFKRNGVETDGRPDLRPSGVKAQRAGTAYNKAAPGADPELAKIWENSGQMLQDFLMKKQGKEGSEARARLDKYEQLTNAYGPNVPSEGGYLIPEETRADIMTRALEGAVVRPQATVVPLSTGKMKWPVNDMTTEVGEVFGGIQFAWLDAGETFAETSGTFGMLALEQHKLGGLASVPNEVTRFIPALETWIREKMPIGIREFEDRALIKGDGVGKPLGGLHANNPALIVADDESGQSTASITWVNVLSMFARLLPESYATAEWDITPDAIPEIFTMALPVGTGGSAVMFGEGGGPNRLAQSILGIPIRWTRKAPAVLGTQGDISLADWTQYTIGDAFAMQFDTSEHSSFRSDKTDFRVLLHVDGQPSLLSPLTPENNGPTLSAFVQLETRSLD
jgi:HK97 family phage major capsid protein